MARSTLLWLAPMGALWFAACGETDALNPQPQAPADDTATATTVGPTGTTGGQVVGSTGDTATTGATGTSGVGGSGNVGTDGNSAGGSTTGGEGGSAGIGGEAGAAGEGGAADGLRAWP